MKYRDLSPDMALSRRAIGVKAISDAIRDSCPFSTFPHGADLDLVLPLPVLPFIEMHELPAETLFYLIEGISVPGSFRSELRHPGV